MTWVRIDDAIANHPKVLKAGSTIGPDGAAVALGMMVWGLSYTSHYLTDGFIPDHAVAHCGRVRRPSDVAQAMVQSGLWERVEGGYRVHDYHDYNPTADEVRAARAAKTDRQRRWRWRRDGDASTPPSTDAPVDASTRPSTVASTPPSVDASTDASRGRLSRARGTRPQEDLSLGSVQVPVQIQRERRSALRDPGVPGEPAEAETGECADELAMRAGAFIRWYEAEYPTHRQGCAYVSKPVRDFDHAVRLCRTYPDDDWLRKMAEVYLRTNHPDAERCARTIGQFSALAPWCESRLREHGHRPASESVPAGQPRSPTAEADDARFEAWRERVRLTLDGNTARYVLGATEGHHDDGQTLTVLVDATTLDYLQRNHLVDTLTDAAVDLGRALILDDGEPTHADPEPPAA